MRVLSSALLVTLALGGLCAGVSVAAQGGPPVSVEQNEAAMKAIATSNGAMQKALKMSDLMTAGTEAKNLVTQFTLVERFWTQHKKDDAIKLAAQARQGATDVVAAAAAGDAAKAQTGAGSIGQTCKQCHSVHREGDQATGFRVKADSLVK
jgi:cytochrome c556